MEHKMNRIKKADTTSTCEASDRLEVDDFAVSGPR